MERMQRWEYKTLGRARGWLGKERKTAYSWAGPWDADVVAELPKLGAEGWELVTVVARSSVLGGYELGGPASSDSIDYAGFTTDELWVFKRPMD